MAMMADTAVLGTTGGAGGAAAPATAPADAGALADAMYGSPGGASPGAGAEGGGAAPVAPAAAAEGEDKGATEDKGTEPELFDPAKLVVPEGMEVDQKGLELVAPVLKELGLDQSKGQQLIDAYIKVRQQELEGQMAIQDQWQDQIKSDKEFGGDKFEVNRDKANRLIERFGDAELQNYLASSGAGNNPAIFRFVARLAAAISEDSPVIPSVAAGQQQQNVLATLYPEKKG